MGLAVRRERVDGSYSEILFAKGVPAWVDGYAVCGGLEACVHLGGWLDPEGGGAGP